MLKILSIHHNHQLKLGIVSMEKYELLKQLLKNICNKTIFSIKLKENTLSHDEPLQYFN